MTVSDQGGTYSGSAFSATATVAAPGGTPGPSLEGVTPTLAYYQGTYASASLLAGHTALSGAPTQAGPYTVLATFTGSTDYTSATAIANFTIAQVLPSVAVTDRGGHLQRHPVPRHGHRHRTRRHARLQPRGRLSGHRLLQWHVHQSSQLSGLTRSPVRRLTPAPTPSWPAFPGSADYASVTTIANFTIAQVTPSVSVNDPGGTYAASAFAATATVTGISGPAAPSLEGVTPRSPTTRAYTATGTPLTGARRPPPAPTPSWPASPAAPITPPSLDGRHLHHRPGHAGGDRHRPGRHLRRLDAPRHGDRRRVGGTAGRQPGGRDACRSPTTVGRIRPSRSSPG